MNAMEKKIEDVLITMGIPVNLSGFDFIKEAVLILDKEGKNVKWFDIYEKIGEKYGKTASQAERAIRHALKVARNAKGCYDVVNHYIGFAANNTSSSIALLYQRIKREMEEDKPKMHTSPEQPVVTEKRVKEIVYETIREMIGGVK